MSFAYDVKKELCSLPISGKQSNDVMLYSMLLFSKHFSDNEIMLKSENSFVIDKYIDMLESSFSVIIEKNSKLRTKSSGGELYTAKVLYEQDSKRIFESFGHNAGQVNLRVNRGFVDDCGDVSAFLRGAFLSCGSVTDPEKGYHLEFCSSYKKLSDDLCAIIREIDECNISAKVLNRNGNYIVYIKDSEQICDLLTYIGAYNCAMSIMGTKALKQVRTNANRRANSEFANLQKTACASANQINAIERIEKYKGLDYLPDDLKEVAKLRLLYPELSLRDLGQLLTPPLSRSSVNHRLTKIISISSEIKGEQNG